MLARVTQKMMLETSLGGMQSNLTRLAKTQEALATGRTINRPSDSPTGVSVAMRLRSSMADQEQYGRNASDGIGWLGQIDSSLNSVIDQVRRSRDLALQGSNNGALSDAAREALAAEIEQIRQGMLSTANQTYLGRPVFGGITAGTTAYDPAGTYVGQPGAVMRTIADGVKIRVDVEGTDVFGPNGASVFDQLGALANALRTNNPAGVQTGLTAMSQALDRVTTVMSDIGTRYARVERANQMAQDTTLSLTGSLSEIESVDLPRATVDLQMQQVAYQAALAATARVTQPSLVDFLR